MQNWANVNWFPLSMIDLKHTLALIKNFSNIFLLYNYVNTFIMCFTFKNVSYIMKFDFNKIWFLTRGGGVVYWIQVFYDKVGRGEDNFFFLAEKGGRGSLDPSIFSWHHMWASSKAIPLLEDQTPMNFLGIANWGPNMNFF